MRASTIVLAIATLASGAHAQAPNTDGPATTLTVSPTDIPTNGRVTFTGLAFPEGNAQVQLTVTAPGASPVALVTSPDANGHYSLQFGGTAKEGTYQVTAQLGTKGPAAKASFTAKTYLIDIDEDVAENKALLGKDSALVKAIRKAVDDVPESPAKEDMSKKLDELEQVTDKSPAQSAKLADALQHFKTLVQNHPETIPFIQPVFDHLSDLGDDEKKTSEQIDAEIEGSKQGGSNCDRIDEMTQSLKSVPDAFNAALGPLDFVLGFVKATAVAALPDSMQATGKAAVDAADLAKSLNDARKGEDATKAWEKVMIAGKTSFAKNEIETGLQTDYGEKLANSVPASMRQSAGYKLAVNEIKKFAPQIIAGNADPKALFKRAVQLAGDALAFGSDQLFLKYCQRFEGKFTATMTAHFYTQGNGADGMPVEWWTYSTALKGKMTLRYPKEAEGRAVQLTGQFEGGATKFTYKEDVFNSIIFGRMVKGGVVHKIDVAPLATDNGEGGAITSLTSPTSFYVPVSGQLVGNTITLTLEPARTDFNETFTQAHTVYAVAAPTTLGLPVWGHFTLPYTNAHFILDHILANSNNTLEVKRSGDKMVIDRNSNKTLPGNGNSATYTLDLKMCNPDCE